MPAPDILRLSPSAGWPGGTAADGTQVHGTPVIIHGRHFHPTPEMHRNQVSFASVSGGRVPAPVEWASVNEVDYQPDGVVVAAATTPGGLDGPSGVAVSAAGNLYIADTGQHRIVRMTPTGDLSSWGSLGSGNGQFIGPTGISVDVDGNVYVADTGNHRIQKFAANGTFITAWGSHGSGLGEYDMPVDVDVTILGGLTFVYVADSNNHRITRTDGTGGMPTSFGAPAGTGRILGVSAPRGYGSVYATDPSNHRILRWAWFGPFNGSYGPAGDPHGMAVIDLSVPMGIEQDFDGYVYVVDQGARVVRKFDSFDPSFRQIARFGLTVPAVPGVPLPDEEFVDPVDIAVTDLKAAYIADRTRDHVVRYTPTDSQEIWVHVPAGATSGSLEVRTDEGTDRAPFSVFEIADVEVADAYLCQGLVEYPLVAGKRTVIRYEMRTVGATQLHNYHWGSPVTDRAVCRILKDGAERGHVEGVAEFITGTGGFMSYETAFEIRFIIPPWLINDEGNYRFEVTLDRTGAHSFHDARSFNGTLRNRQSYRIVSTPITHLKHDGTRVSPSSMFPALFYMGSDVGHFLDWVDWAQLYAGYLTYNRLYPVRHSLGDIAEYGIWVNDTMANGINSKDEVKDMLQGLELTRRRLNEESGAHYDFMLGVVLRDEWHLGWGGATSGAYRSAIVSIGTDQFGDPAYDVGAVIGHELLHQHSQDHQSVRERASSAKDAWNSFTGFFVRDPVTLMYDPPEGAGRTLAWNDRTAFVEARENGESGNYDVLFDALANPHPKRVHLREMVYSQDDPQRPAGARRNFTLVGELTSTGEFARLASWIGKSTTPVTPEAEDSEGRLVFLDARERELLRWAIHVSFGLREVKPGQASSRLAEDTALISVAVPFPDATSRVSLVVNTTTVWGADVPSQAPTVQLLTPRGGEHVAPTDTLRAEWEAGHPQGIELEYTIEYSYDGGETFRPIVMGLRETHYEWQSGLASSTGRVQVRVVASDGFNQASDTSDDIQVDDVARRIVIVQPQAGEAIPEGGAIPLLAVATDLELGSIPLNAGNTRWILDEEVVLGQGNDFDFRAIEPTTPLGTVMTSPPVGPHRLRVQVTTTAGQTLWDEIPVEIVADSDRDGVPDDVEIERGTSPTDPGDGATIAPIYPFGQWRFRRWRSRTVYQISHLGTGNLILELSFLDEKGSPLKEHPLHLVADGSIRRLATDEDGRAQITLGSLQTRLLILGASRHRYKGFGICHLRVARNSPVRETTVQAHAWIHRRRGWWLFGWESQGTIAINAGRPMPIRGAQGWSASSPQMAAPAVNWRSLGRLTLATHSVSRGLQLSDESGTLEGQTS